MPVAPLHPFVKPLSSNVDPDHFRYLGRAGALAIPAQPLREELLRHFIEFVQPSMPLLDVHELVASVDGEKSRSPVSLLLFQAIMFSGATTIDTAFLEATGYATRRGSTILSLPEDKAVVRLRLRDRLDSTDPIPSPDDAVVRDGE